MLFNQAWAECSIACVDDDRDKMTDSSLALQLQEATPPQLLSVLHTHISAFVQSHTQACLCLPAS